MFFYLQSGCLPGENNDRVGGVDGRLEGRLMM